MKLSAPYILVHILGRFPISDSFWNKFVTQWRMRLFLLCIYFYFSSTNWHPQILYKATSIIPKSQKIEINFYLDILFYAVFIGKLQKSHLFQCSRQEMFYMLGVLKNFARFTGKHLCRSLIHYNVAGCCFCSLSGIYKTLTHAPTFLSSNSFLFCFLSQRTNLPF